MRSREELADLLLAGISSRVRAAALVNADALTSARTNLAHPEELGRIA